MQDDLIERLRAYRPANDWGDGIRHDICDEAADAGEADNARIAALEADLKAKTTLADDHFRNAKRLAGRCAALEADNARLMGLVKDVEQTLALIYAGDEGPVLLNNSVKAVCARRHEVGGLLRNVIRTLAKIKETPDA